MLWCSIQAIRERKCRMIMEALAKGWPDARCCNGDPPDDGNPFAVYGQTWGAERLLPKAIQTQRPFWTIDNGYWRPGRGSRAGYYRICYRSMTPVYLRDVTDLRGRRSGVAMKPWRSNGNHILFALPGIEYGRAMGLRMDEWIWKTSHAMRTRTHRPIVRRDRSCQVPLSVHFQNCWAVVTHSSNVSVEAAIAGIPVFVAPDSSAAPVGNVDLNDLENPMMPGNRDAWWNSLMSQQFTPREMASGVAFDYLTRVRDQVDARLAA